PDTAARARAVEDILAMLARLPSEIERDFHVKSLSERIGIAADSLVREMEKRAPASGRSVAERGVALLSDRAPGAGAEAFLLRLLIADPSLREQIPPRFIETEFVSEECRELGEGLLAVYRRGASFQAWLDEIEDEALRRRAAALAAEEIPIGEAEPGEMFGDCLRKISKNKRDSDSRRLTERINEARHHGDKIKVEALLREKDTLQRHRRADEGPISSGTP
ncbi:MAG: hypothetical protein ACRD1Z_02525, partial [Vicinamibacteria bacterium]